MPKFEACCRLRNLSVSIEFSVVPAKQSARLVRLKLITLSESVGNPSKQCVMVIPPLFKNKFSVTCLFRQNTQSMLQCAGLEIYK